jgi:hydroxypyruvate isomerase
LIRLAANLSYLFTELPFLERFDAAREAGFRAVEWNFAFEFPLSEVAARMRYAGLKLALLNSPAGDVAAGELGLAVLPGREQDTAAAFNLALHWALELGAPTIHFLAGNAPAAVDPAEIDKVFLGNMMRAADLAAGAGIAITVEPLNPRDRPGYHVLSVAHALQLIQTAGRDNIKLQLDMYHCQITGGDIIRTMERTIHRIGHVQIAGVPDRDEPLASERVLARLDALGYQGYVGCEYRPSAGTLQGLDWAYPYLRREHP